MLTENLETINIQKGRSRIYFLQFVYDEHANQHLVYAFFRCPPQKVDNGNDGTVPEKMKRDAFALILSLMIGFDFCDFD